jgi:hypothetical protein
MKWYSRAAVLVGACTLIGLPFTAPRAQNHPPETYIHLDTLFDPCPQCMGPIAQLIPVRYYSLSGPTATFDGIPIAWSGSDSSDYPGTQPPFDFNWLLFGPYTDHDSALPDSSRMVSTNDDPNTPQLEWTADSTYDAFDLRTGWYLFWVRARDDSLAIDSTPAMTRFEVIEPTFTKPFLLMDASNWRNGALLNAGSIDFRNPRTDSLRHDTIRTMYEDIFDGHSYIFDRTLDTWYRQADDSLCPDCYLDTPHPSILSQYNALIVYDEDMQLPLDRDSRWREFETKLSDYLDVGGRVVLIGRNLFARSVTGWDPTAPAQEATFVPTHFAFDYFAVTSMCFPGHLGSSLNFSTDSSEFQNAVPLDPKFPALTTDTMRTLYLSQVPMPGLTDRNGDGFANWLWTPDVNCLSIDSSRGARALYQFNSSQPGTSPSQGRVCGAAYEYYDTLLADYTFRTAILTFPLFPMRQDTDLRVLAGELLDYILGGTPASVNDEGSHKPEQPGLVFNYPNPFNAQTTIRYNVDRNDHVHLTIHNLLGQRVATLVNTVKPPGVHEARWNGLNEAGIEVGSGTYFGRLEVGGSVQSRSMTLLK